MCGHAIMLIKKSKCNTASRDGVGGVRESADLSTQDKSYRFSRWLILTKVYKLGDL
jgi:hypothetical protein